MTRSVVKWGLAALGGVTLAGPAPAQIISVPNPVTGGTFNYTRYNYQSLNVGGYSFNRIYYGAPRPSIAASPYRSGYLSGGIGGGASVDPRAGQKKNDLARAQRRGGWAAPAPAPDARAAITEQWAYERGAKPVPAVGPVGKPANVNPGLLDATPAEVASGAGLNDLLAAVEPLDAKAPRAVESALLPPDLAARMVFTGGPAADAVNLLRAGTLDFPAALLDTKFDTLRADLTREYVVLGEAATQTRATAAGAADRVAAAVHKARESVAPVAAEMPYADAVEVARFFNRLEAAARLLKDPALAQAFVPAWSTLGVTVQELVRHMARHGLTFGPAASADASAYDGLYRGLADYYVALSRVGK